MSNAFRVSKFMSDVPVVTILKKSAGGHMEQAQVYVHVRITLA